MKPNSPGVAAAEARDWEAAVAMPAFRTLIAAKKKLLAPMVLIYLVVFMGTTLLAGYWKPLMTMKVIGSFNVAYLIVFCIYLMCWIMAVLYVRVANRDFDPLAARAIEELTQHARSPNAKDKVPA